MREINLVLRAIFSITQEVEEIKEVHSLLQTLGEILPGIYGILSRCGFALFCVKEKWRIRWDAPLWIQIPYKGSEPLYESLLCLLKSVT